jgi:hypothetical protein
VAVSFEEPEYTANRTRSARCVCWKRSASWAWRERRASTRLPLRSSTAWCERLRRRNPHHSTRAAHKAWPSFTATG